MIVKSGQNTPHGSGFILLPRRLVERAALLRRGPNRRRSISASSAPRIGGPIVQEPHVLLLRLRRHAQRSRDDRHGDGRAPRHAARRLLGADDRRFAILSRGQPFPGNVIPAERARAAGAGAAGLHPAADPAGPAEQLRRTRRATDERENQYFVRLDHQFSTSTSLFGRVAHSVTATIDTIMLNPNFQSIGRPENQNYVDRLHARASRRGWLLEARVLVRRANRPRTDRARGRGHRPAPRLRHQRPEHSRPAAARHSERRHHRLHGHRRDVRESAAALRSPGWAGSHSCYELTGHSLRFGVEVFRRTRTSSRSTPAIRASFSFTGLLSRQRVRRLHPRPAGSDRPHPEPGRVSLRRTTSTPTCRTTGACRRTLTVNAGLRYEYAGSLPKTSSASRAT